MIEVYEKEILSLLEQAVPVWHSGLTVIQENAIERVQKAALYVILDSNYNNYENACAITGLTPLKQRREQICLKFARKNLKQKDSLFKKENISLNLRRKERVKEYFCRTRRFERSPLPYLSKLLNNATK